MPERDPYEVLGASRTAGPEDLHACYLERMHQVHPDLHSSDMDAAHERAVEVVAAYRLLSDPVARRRHDFRARFPFRQDGVLPGLKLLKGRSREEAERRFLEGMLRVREDELARAIEPFKAAVRLEPAFAAAAYNLGLAAALLGNGPYALDVLTEGLTNCPKDDGLKRLRQAVASTFMTA